MGRYSNTSDLYSTGVILKTLLDNSDFDHEEEDYKKLSDLQIALTKKYSKDRISYHKFFFHPIFKKKKSSTKELSEMIEDLREENRKKDKTIQFLASLLDPETSQQAIQVLNEQLTELRKQ